MGKTPAARGFTLAERRSLRFEGVSLYMLGLVALIAAVISFVALTYVGHRMSLGFAAFLIPVAIDGFGIACSVGIVTSQQAGESAKDRISEWVGLMCALGLSIAGNVWHVLETRDPTLPAPLAGTFAAAVPLIVAYGVHVYGRAMSKGISAHVLADTPDVLTFGLAHIGAHEQPAARATPARPAAQPARTPTAQPARTPAPAPAPAPARAEGLKGEEARAAMRPLFEQAVAQAPGTKPDAAELARAAGVDMHPATPRRWVQSWWDDLQAAAEPGRDPILEQLGGGARAAEGAA